MSLLTSPLIYSLPTAEQTGLPSNAVSAANRAVEKTLRGSDGDDDHKRPRKYTTTFTSEDRAKVGQYAAQNGVARALRHFQSLNLSESTVRYFRKLYLAEVSKRAKAKDQSTEVTRLDVAKRGRRSHLEKSSTHECVVLLQSTIFKQ